MKLIIDIPEEDYKRGTLCQYFGCYSMELHNTILNGTPIPDNATFGEVIEMITNRKPLEDNSNSEYIMISEKLYNAPYQKGGK